MCFSDESGSSFCCIALYSFVVFLKYRKYIIVWLYLSTIVWSTIETKAHGSKFWTCAFLCYRSSFGTSI